MKNKYLIILGELPERILIQLHTTYLYHTFYTDVYTGKYPNFKNLIETKFNFPCFSCQELTLNLYKNKILFTNYNNKLVYFYTNSDSFPSV